MGKVIDFPGETQAPAADPALEIAKIDRAQELVSRASVSCSVETLIRVAVLYLTDTKGADETAHLCHRMASYARFYESSKPNDPGAA